MSIPYHRIASAFYNRPLLLTPNSAEVISVFLTSRIAAGRGAGAGQNDAGESIQAFPSQPRPDGSVEVHQPRASRFYGDYPIDERTGRPAPYRRTEDGTAIITVVGELVNRGAWVGASSGLISYEGFKHQIGAAAGDPKVRTIVLDFESPGGEAIGAFEAAAAVRAAAAEKPVLAVVNGMAASAAYAIASAASRVITMASGLSGSIGVVLMHLDYSAWLKAEGIAPTLIFAGAQKVDGNPFEPLPEPVRERLQAQVSGFYDQFVETVTQGRKGLTAKAVRDTEAGLFKGAAAVSAGLADAVGTFEEVLADLSARAPRSAARRGKL
ncbi:S49 family peptidase [Rhodoplanes sp. SY1]|uniref:S49 family peptidase n=1 Tax=Rhodoplanes sp. SY1 TaxID=3166646 RepID=UPI0038B5A2AF